MKVLHSCARLAGHFRIIVLFGYGTNSPPQWPPSANVGLGGTSISDTQGRIGNFVGKFR
jgi:hypothetical protein